ncbi:MAG: serine/threonine-protein phosphatase [Ruminococcus sp.]|nr:serine/threonine-protein phosphatase [Ruminococcus sp.]
MKVESINSSRYRYLGTTAEILTMIFLSFIIANSTLSGVQSSLNIALMGALPPIYAGSVLAGSLIAYFTADNFLNSAVMICAMLLVAGVRIFINKRISNVYNSLITTLCMLGGGIVIFTATEQDINTISIHICLSIITGLVQYFLAQLFYEDDYGFHINTDSVISLSVAYALLVATFCSVDIWNVNIGVVLGVICVLCCSKIYGISGSGICGILTTCGMLLFNSELGFSTIFFAMGGLACGIISQQHKSISGIFFICINVIGLMLVGDVNYFVLSMGGIFVGTLVFLCIPSKVFKMETDGSILPYTTPDVSFLDTIEARLKYSIQSLKDVRLSTSGIASAIDKRFKPLDVTEEVYHQVCVNCRNRKFCWEKNSEKTKENFEVLRAYDCEDITPTNMPEFFNWCFKRTDIADAFVRNIKRRELLIHNDIKSKEDRETLYAQIRLAENVISSVMENILVRYKPKVQITEDVSIYLRDKHIAFLNVSAYLNDVSKLTIEVYIKDENLQFAELEKDISVIAERDMEFLNITLIDDFYRVTFCESKEYSIDVHTSQKVSENYSICGDTADNFTDCYGNQYAVISDGMGRGNSASIDSQLAVRLFKKLTLSGLDVSSTIDTLNALIMTKSSDESFATLDVFRLDTYSGTADIFKAGATSTIMKVDGEVKLIEGVSYPLGIMQEVSLFNYKLNVNVGDIIIMISDGVDESLYQYIKTVLLLDTCTDVSVLAHNICSTAYENSNKQSDDITVTAIKIV